MIVGVSGKLKSSHIQPWERAYLDLNIAMIFNRNSGVWNCFSSADVILSDCHSDCIFIHIGWIVGFGPFTVGQTLCFGRSHLC